MSQPIRLTATARLALRKAITDHTNWTSAFRNKHGFSLATMSRDDYFRCAELLGINASAIAASVNEEKAAEAREIFSDKPAAEALKRDAAEIMDESTEAGRASIAARAKNEAARGAFTQKEGNGMSDNSGAAGKLAALIAELSTTTVDEAQVRAIVKREIDLALAEHVGPVVRIEITENGLPVGKVEGHQHPEFAKMLRAATARDASGFCLNVWIAGPAGSGKTFAVSQIAKALDVGFHFNGAISMPHELLGFIDAGGTYHRTPFRDAYEHGGCYLFDEVDGSDNAALLALNAALANGMATFPDGQIKRHPECRIFAAANTWGFGATAEYVGRAKLDAAFLSRFPVRIMWSYDEELERNICGNPDAARMVQRARHAARELGLKVLITPRDSIACAALVAAGFTLSDAAEMSYMASLTPDQKSMMERKLVEMRG